MVVKATSRGIAQVVGGIGDTTYYGISVEGHCMGIVGRTWRDPTQSSGYAYACDGAKAVANAGKMRSGRPPKGSVVWMSTGGGTYAQPGHVLTMEDDVITVGNIGSTIQRRSIDAWTLPRIGWCWPEDVPTWGKSPTPGGGDDDMPLSEEDLNKIAAKVWAYDVDPSGGKYSASGALWTAFQRTAVLNDLGRAVWSWASRTLTSGGGGGTGPSAEEIANATATKFSDRLKS